MDVEGEIYSGVAAVCENTPKGMGAACEQTEDLSTNLGGKPPTNVSVSSMSSRLGGCMSDLMSHGSGHLQREATMKTYLNAKEHEIFGYSPIIEYEGKLDLSGSIAQMFLKDLNLSGDDEGDGELQAQKIKVWVDDGWKNSLRERLKRKKNNVANTVKKKMEGKSVLRVCFFVGCKASAACEG